jgi:hypothetical protein
MAKEFALECDGETYKHPKRRKVDASGFPR